MKITHILESYLLESVTKDLAKARSKDIVAAYKQDTHQISGINTNTNPQEMATLIIKEISKINNEPKFIKALTAWYINKEFRLDNGTFPSDIDHIKETIKNYKDIVQHHPEEISNDIQTFKHLYQLQRNIGAALSNIRDKPAKKQKPDYTTHYKDDDILVVIPNNWEAAISLANQSIPKANWCVAVDSTEGQSYFNDYSRDGSLYFIKTKNKQYFMFHFQRQEFRDVQDEQVKLAHTIEQYPAILKAFNETEIGYMVKFDTFVLDGIEDPSIELQLRAVKDDANAIYYIKNPAQEAINLAVQTVPKVIEAISIHNKIEKHTIKLATRTIVHYPYGRNDSRMPFIKHIPKMLIKPIVQYLKELQRDKSKSRVDFVKTFFIAFTRENIEMPEELQQLQNELYPA